MRLDPVDGPSLDPAWTQLMNPAGPSLDPAWGPSLDPAAGPGWILLSASQTSAFQCQIRGESRRWAFHSLSLQLFSTTALRISTRMNAHEHEENKSKWKTDFVYENNAAFYKKSDVVPPLPRSTCLVSCYPVNWPPGPTIPHWYRRHQTINTFYSPTGTNH